ncbi:ATP-binding protein [Chitinimonas koreensis]|uniref:ATP-binding protein n=1 Tax=Chitinimonas koreensis TaxID=356302 RepID=UPI000553652D|nr:ATP-binding protein [Chitinimonas koreensis]QNM95216.1 sensor histidine kinase [Chitinimonas koreensis]
MPEPRRLARRMPWWLAALLAGAAVLWLAGRLAEQSELARIRQAGGHRLEVYVGSLRNAVDKYAYLPYVLSINDDVAGLLARPQDAARRERVNRYLETVNRSARSSALYLLDAHGEAIAASNWNTPQSYVGNNYAFRPYYQDARAGRPGRFYGVGATTRQPGYFLSQPVFDARGVAGVVVAKVSLDALETSWQRAGDRVLVADRAGIAFLSAVPAWKLRSLAPVAAPALDYIRQTSQYDRRSFSPLGLVELSALDADARVVALPEGRGRSAWLAQTVALDDHGWRVLLLSDLAPLRQTVRNALVATGFGLIALWLLLLYWRQRRRRIRDNLAAGEALRRAHDELERKVAERTRDLIDSNRALEREVAERKRTETELRAAQDELVQAAKLAVLGQMAAGVTHELNQPLAAMRTLADNAVTLLDRGRPEQARGNLGMIAGLVERMGRITGQLRAFARKRSADRPAVAVPVAQALANARLLLEDRFARRRVALQLTLADPGVAVLGDQVRLEQVLINLLRNALDAVAEIAAPRIEVRVDTLGERVRIEVCDNGPGIAAEALGRLFEPFFTTKDGEGLGLGLAISLSILRDCQGRLSAANRAEGGACFTIELPAAPAG